MYQATRAVELNVSAEEGWRWIGDFHGLYRFHPLIRETRVENHGLWRRDMFKDLDAGSLEERLHFSDRAMAYSYRSLNAGGGFWPIDAYVGRLKVWPRGEGRCGVLWGAQLVPKDPRDTATNEGMVPQMVENELRGLGGLVERVGGRVLPPTPHDYSCTRTARLDAGPDDVWAVVGDFFGIADWIPTVERVTRVGNGRRFVHLRDRDQVDVEDEIFRDDVARVLTYRASLEPGSAYPCDDYTGHLKVWEPSGGGSAVAWSAQFTPSRPDDDATVGAVVEQLRAQFERSLAGLAERFGGRRLNATGR